MAKQLTKPEHPVQDADWLTKEVPLCETKACVSAASYYCEDAKLYCCADCLIHLYSECEHQRLVDVNELTKWVSAVDRIIANSEAYFAHSLDSVKWSTFAHVLQSFRHRLCTLQESLQATVEAKEYKGLLHIQKELVSLKSDLQNHPEYIRYLKHKENSEVYTRNIAIIAEEILIEQKVNQRVAVVLEQKEKQLGQFIEEQDNDKVDSEVQQHEDRHQ